MTQSQKQITFHFLVPFSLTQRNKLRSFVSWLIHRESHKLSDLSFVFCDDKYLLELNRQFLRHDYYTDILSFPASGGKDRVVAGEIYISLDRVRENARARGLSLREEMHRVIFHGVLHFCRYKDKTARDQLIMRSKEDEYLKKYFK